MADLTSEQRAAQEELASTLNEEETIPSELYCEYLPHPQGAQDHNFVPVHGDNYSLDGCYVYYDSKLNKWRPYDPV